MMRLLDFNSLITPLIVRILYYLGIALVAAGAVSLYGSLHYYMGNLTIIVAILTFVFGVLVARVGAEITLVLFMIRDELAWQREHAKSDR